MDTSKNTDRITLIERIAIKNNCTASYVRMIKNKDRRPTRGKGLAVVSDLDKINDILL